MALNSNGYKIPVPNYFNTEKPSALLNSSKPSNSNKVEYFSNGYQPKSIGFTGNTVSESGLKVKDTSLAGSKNMAGSTMDNQTVWKTKDGNLFVWVGNDGNAIKNNSGQNTYGYYVQVGSDGKVWSDYKTTDYSNNAVKQMILTNNNATGLSSGYINAKMDVPGVSKGAVNELHIKPPEKTNTGSSASTTPTSSSPYYSYLTNKIAELTKQIDELKNPKLKSAEEMASIYGIDYNLENILNNYNNKTNDYYNNAISEMQDVRDDYIRNNSQFLNNVVDNYLDSYKYQAPTATNRGIQAANVLATTLGADADNSANDYGMYQSIQNLEQARQAELANNPKLAEQYYNNIGQYLSSKSAQLYDSDIKQHVADLDAYASNYAADRSYQSYLAQANAAKYSGLAQAAANTAYGASQIANSPANTFQKLYDYYYNTNNRNNNSAANRVKQNLMGVN